MRILGVDPGLIHTGYGIIDFQANTIKLREAGVIEPNTREPIQNRIQKVYLNLKEILQQHCPDVMVLEKLYAHFKHPTTACLLGHVRGAICLLCAHQNIQLIEHDVKRIRKAITGNGNSSKMQIQKVVAYLLNIQESRLTPDASDALALALGHVHMTRQVR